jgi:hypothetical protein
MRFAQASAYCVIQAAYYEAFEGDPEDYRTRWPRLWNAVDAYEECFGKRVEPSDPELRRILYQMPLVMELEIGEE